MHKAYVKHINCKLYYRQLHLKYLCNLVRYWLQAVWGWHDSVETCSSVIICGEIIVHLLVRVQNNKNTKWKKIKTKITPHSLKYYLRSLIPASQFSIFYHSNIESCNHTVMCPIYLVFSHSDDILRVKQLSKDYMVHSSYVSCCFLKMETFCCPETLMP